MFCVHLSSLNFPYYLWGLIWRYPRNRGERVMNKGSSDDDWHGEPGVSLHLTVSLFTCLSPRLTFFTHFTLSIHAVGGSERSERFTFPSGRLRRVKREGVTRPPGRFPSRDGRQARREKETRHGSGSCLSVTLHLRYATAWVTTRREGTKRRRVDMTAIYFHNLLFTYYSLGSCK